MREFSFYKDGITNTIPTATINISQIADGIRNDEKLKKRTIALRQENDPEEKKKLKESLPYVTFSGTFSKRGNDHLIQHSGGICIDLDHLQEEDISLLKQKIRLYNDPALMFISPSGFGLKIVFEIDLEAGSHLDYYYALESFFKENFRLKTDPQCKDVSRACFLCHDPDAEFPEFPSLLDAVFLERYSPKQNPEPQQENNNPVTYTYDDLKTWVSKNYGEFIQGNRNKYITQLAAACHRNRISQQEVLNRMREFDSPDFPFNTEISKPIASLYNNASWEKDYAYMESSRINPLSEIAEPPVFCKIGKSPSMTSGNFSLLTGKAKSGKTTFAGAVVAAMLTNSTQLAELKGSLPADKNMVLYFDTEQSVFHSTRTIKRICSLTGNPNPANLIPYGLRPFTPAERLAFIDQKIKTTPNLGVCVIDGIRDLMTMGINDEAETTSLVSKFLKWTGDHSIHLILLLHLNKTDSNARGHIGTECLNKAESIINITKDKTNIFVVSCEYSRDFGFDDFGFTIEDGQATCSGLPDEEKASTKNPHRIDDQKHFTVLNSIFRKYDKLSYSELQREICDGFEGTFGESASRAFITHYLNKDWINKERDGHKTFYTYNRAIF